MYRSGFTLVELLVVIVIIAALAGLTAPMVMKQRKKADQTEAISNGKQIGIALFQFETDYGTYPDKETAVVVADSTGSTMDTSGDTSNDYFRQLIAAKVTESEVMFYAKTPYTPRKPDDDISAGQALKPGEVGYGYIMNDESGFSSAGNPGRPVAVTPLLLGSTTGEFDPDAFLGKAVVVKMDNSVVSYQIREDKKISLGAGRTLLDNSEGSIWGAATPVLKAPATK
ncbi:type II secretion system protein [Luteolibacter pohnpeiensis]|nr:prepilin-type N-terminal cleavage/methylation domain-containing protein [Luteolibacter pohnpeiensis]